MERVELPPGVWTEGVVFLEEVPAGGSEEGGFGHDDGGVREVLGCECTLAFESAGFDFVEHLGDIEFGEFLEGFASIIAFFFFSLPAD